MLLLLLGVLRVRRGGGMMCVMLAVSRRSCSRNRSGGSNGRSGSLRQKVFSQLLLVLMLLVVRVTTALLAESRLIECIAILLLRLLAILLSEGATLREAAKELGITENSARTYSKRIFMKAGVGRQADLIRLILRSVAMFGDS